MQNVKIEFEKTKKLAAKIKEPEWVAVATAASRPEDTGKGATQILAQCCKPGPCSPKWSGE